MLHAYVKPSLLSCMITIRLYKFVCGSATYPFNRYYCGNNALYLSIDCWRIVYTWVTAAVNRHNTDITSMGQTTPFKIIIKAN